VRCPCAWVNCSSTTSPYRRLRLEHPFDLAQRDVEGRETLGLVPVALPGQPLKAYSHFLPDPLIESGDALYPGGSEHVGDLKRANPELR
jgi:hypothetical protein